MQRSTTVTKLSLKKMLMSKYISIDQSIDRSINRYFIMCPKVDWRASQLSLPYVGITKTERNRTKT